ncbi:MAG: hypothetical protein VW907_00800 [Opitutae bacterium]
MAVTDAQIRAVLSANPNASDARILKALANYGVSPERFTAVTGRTLGASPTITPATPAPAPVAQSYQMPSYGNMTDAEMYAAMAGQQYQAPAPVYQPPTPAPTPVITRPVTPAPVSVAQPVAQKVASAPVSVTPAVVPKPAPAPAPAANTTTASGITDTQIRAALAANPNATPERIAKAMVNYGVTPSDVRRVTGASFEDNAAIRQAYGQAGGFTDQQIRDAVMGRAEGQGFASQSEIQKAAQNYGITPEQLARVFPQVQPGSLNQVPIVTAQEGLMPAVSALGRAADVTRDTSRQGQQELLDRLSALEGRVGGIYDTAQGYQQTYRDLGQEAAQRQAALTGALGPEAQAQAFAEYQASPALDYLQQQSERALTRQAAALGGLGGGNVRQDLVKLTADLYGQDYANQFARLGEIAQRGYGAAGTSAQLGGQQAGTIAGVGQAGATTAAQMQDALSGRLGNILGTEAQYRMRAGENIADAIAAGTSQIGGLQVGASDAYRNLYGNLTDAQLQTAKDLATQYGNAVANQYLAQANLYQGQGSALAGVPGQTFTPVPGYSIGGAFGAGGLAYDLAGTLFGGSGSGGAGTGTGAGAGIAGTAQVGTGSARSYGQDPFLAGF